MKSDEGPGVASDARAHELALGGAQRALARSAHTSSFTIARSNDSPARGERLRGDPGANAPLLLHARAACTARRWTRFATASSRTIDEPARGRGGPGAHGIDALARQDAASPGGRDGARARRQPRALGAPRGPGRGRDQHEQPRTTRSCRNAPGCGRMSNAGPRWTSSTATAMATGAQRGGGGVRITADCPLLDPAGRRLGGGGAARRAEMRLREQYARAHLSPGPRRGSGLGIRHGHCRLRRRATRTSAST
jgi:hypothetical protein